MNSTLAEALSNIADFIRAFISLSESEGTVIALWVAHTHAFDAANTTPYLSITSAEKQCGKTLLLEVLELLVAKPWMTAHCTVAVLPRKINAECPTLLLDESDPAFNGNREYAEALRGILNSGHRRGGKSTICVKHDGDVVPRDFNTFCPKAIAGIGELPDTVADRSIPIRLKRAHRAALARFRRRDVESDATMLRDDLVALLSESLSSLREARPTLPNELTSRQQDGAEPLLAIADVVGGEWPGRARAALVQILKSIEAKDDSPGVKLLADIRCIIEASKRDRIASKKLVAALAAIETSPWAALTVHTLAKMLHRYRISPRTIRNGKQTFKGYLKQDFSDAWSRHLPAPPKQS